MSTKVILENGNILVKELVRKEEEEKTFKGIFISKETLDDEQVSQGIVKETCSEEYSIGDVVLFHKVLPVDAMLKLEGDEELKTYYFIQSKDIICKIIEQ